MTEYPHMTLTIYHNPRCSKSRKTLELINENGLDPEVVEYLKTPPDSEVILRLAAELGLPVRSLMRTGEAAYKEATDIPDESDDDALASWLSQHPIVIERPIVSDGTRAVIGRPPENVLSLLGDE